MYGGREADERPVQLMTLEGKLRDMRCNSPKESSEFIVKLDRIWAEFEELGDAKAEATRRASLLLGIKKISSTGLCSTDDSTRYDVQRAETSNQSFVVVSHVGTRTPSGSDGVSGNG